MYNNSLNNNDIEHSLYFSLLNPYLEYEPDPEDDDGIGDGANSNEDNKKSLQEKKKRTLSASTSIEKVMSTFY